MISGLAANQHEEIHHGGLPLGRPLLSLSLKTKQVALGIFAAFFFAAGMISLVTLSGGFFTAIPAFVLGGITVWFIGRVKAYRDPVALQQYREEALQQPLTKTVEQHGWRNMNTHKIPTKEEFPRLFIETVKNLTVKEAVRFWQEANHAQEGVEDPFTIPGAEILREKWQRETQGMSVARVLATYEVKKYVQLGFAHRRLLQAITAYDDALQRYSTQQFSTREFEAECSTLDGKYAQFLSGETE